MKFNKFTEGLMNIVAPFEFKCVVCGADVFDMSGFCTECLKDVQFNNGKTCKRCGVSISGDEDYCGHCAFEHVYFDKAYSPLKYSGNVQEAILNMKFNSMAVNAKIFARYLAFAAYRYNLSFDLVTYIPMTKSAEKRRGYNQSELLARYFCDIMDCSDKLTCLLEKVKETKRQETLNKIQRKENLIGAFCATGDLHGLTILLIDDIKTTGSTLNECAKALKKKGAAKVIGLTVSSREEDYMWEREDET